MNIRTPLLVAAAAAAIAALVLLTPSPITPTSYQYPTLPELPHQHRSSLRDGCRRLSPVQPFTPPESFQVDAMGRLYTGLGDGRIVRTKTQNLFGQWETVARTGEELQQCHNEEYELKCGRPLGLKFDKEGKLLIADSSKGLLSLDVETGKLETLVNDSDVSFANSIAIDKNSELIYFTDSSNRFRRTQVLFELIEGGPNGRLLSYNRKTGQVKVELENLHFPNGLAWTQEGNLLIVETTRSRILEWKTGSNDTSVWLENIAGVPDNLVPRGDEYNPSSYLLGMGGKRSTPFSLLHSMAPYPEIRKFVTRVIPYKWIIKLQPTYALSAELSTTGEILKYLQDDQSPTLIPFISELFEFGDYIVVGSFHNPFLGVCPRSVLDD